MLPITAISIKTTVSSYQMNRMEHVLQEAAAQVWLCQYFAFIAGGEFYLVLDESEARQQLTQTIESNFMLSNLDNAQVDSINFSTVTRYSSSDLSDWHIPLIIIKASLNDHTGTDVYASYEYEMAPDPVKLREDGIYQ
jgi:hypothetical protein